MSYNPFETKRRNEMIARLEKERNMFRDSAKELRKEVESLRQERDMLRTACGYLEQFKPEWIKIESEEDLPKHSVWLSNKTDVWQGKLFIPDTKTRVNLLATHYAPITKPQPPKED